MSQNFGIFKDQFNKTDVLVTTPLKFLKLVKSVGLNLEDVKYLVLDEADKFFEFVIMLYDDREC